MISEDGMKLVEFVNNSFSTSIKSALEKQSKEKRRINSRKYIEKNRQKTARKSVKAVNNKPKVTGNKSQSQRLQQNRFYNHLTTSIDESQCLPPWPAAFDNGYTILPGCTVPETLVFPPTFTPQQGSYQSRLPVARAMTQSTLDLEHVLQTLIEPQVPVSLPTQFTTPFETTVDYAVDTFSDHSRPLSPYNNSNISDKEYLEDLMIDQFGSSPASTYSSSPNGSCVPSPANRVCDSQMSYAMYEHLPYH